jgi:acetyltransferase EpsM
VRIAIIGAGGHGTVVADILLRMREAGADVEPIAFVDDHPAPNAPPILSLPVLRGGLADLAKLACDAALVAIGHNATRQRICELLRQSGFKLAVARHPSSVIAPDAVVETGAVICAGAVINPGSRIGVGAIINTQASVDHHNWIGDYVHIAPGVHLGGDVRVGNGSLVGIGATVGPQCRIGRGVVVGAGAVVVSNLPDDVVATGLPARPRTSISRLATPHKPLAAIARRVGE